MVRIQYELATKEILVKMFHSENDAKSFFFNLRVVSLVAI